MILLWNMIRERDDGCYYLMDMLRLLLLLLLVLGVGVTLVSVTLV